MKVKNITFIGLNYAPEDTAIGLYSTQWVDYLSENGYNVSVISAFPYYPQWKILESYKDKSTFYKETRNDIKIYRYKQYVPKNPNFFKRIIHLIDFTFGSFINLFKVKKCDIVIAVVPFTTSIFLGYIQKLRFRAPLWVHIQDFEFDAALQTGVGKKKNLFFILLFRLEKWLFSKANIASTISKSMLLRLEEKTSSKQFYLPNWIDEEQFDPATAAQHDYLKSAKTKILYSGNIGDKQDWDAFILFCQELDPNTYEVVLVGNGAKCEWVIEQLKSLSHVHYYEPVPYEALSSLLCSTDIHVLFQKPDVIDTVMPSKVLGMMASAKPSIIIGNEKSEVKTIFEASKGGFYFTRYSDELILTLEKLSKDISLQAEIGNKARNYVIQNYSKDQILSKMLTQLDAL